MNKTAIFAVAFGLGLVASPAAHGGISFLDGSELPGIPWVYYERPDVLEGNVQIFDLGSGNMALRLDSLAHMDGENRTDQTEHANEYYAFRDEMGVPTENVVGSRFRLMEFTPTGKENLLSVTINNGLDEDGDGQPDGNFWVWSYTTNESILDLGPTVAGQFHEAYVMARNNGTAQVSWDGAMVLDGPVPKSGDFADYVEFGSGTSWQTTAGTTVDFDWVGWGDITDMPAPPSVVGDYNNNGTVDAADYAAWRDNLGQSVTLPNDSTPGTVTQVDYDVWRANFGATSVAGIGNAVPEPAAWPLMMAAAVLPLTIRRRD